MREQNTPQQAVGVESCSGLAQSREEGLYYGATRPEGRNLAVTFLINIHLKSLRIGFLVVWFFGLTACVQADPGTRADREASFDVIVAKIMAREAFSELLGIDVPTTLRLAEH